MKEFLLLHNWIFAIFGLFVMYGAIYFKNLWVGANSKLEDVVTWYAIVILVYGSVKLWTGDTCQSFTEKSKRIKDGALSWS